MTFRVLLDVDGVLADFPQAVIDWLNSLKLGCLYRLEDVREHDILKNFGLESLQARLDQWCIDTDMCRELPVYEGAQAFVEELKSFADVVVVTAKYKKVPNWCSAREAWLEQHFGIHPDNVIHAKRKECVSGNMLLDDKLRNIDAWRVAWGHQGVATVFDRPWNQGLQLRVTSYEGALGVAREAAEAVSRLNSPQQQIDWSAL